MVMKILRIQFLTEALSPAFIHAGADLWPHPLNFANAEQIQQLQQQALLHPALQHQLPVRSFLWLTDSQGNGKNDSKLNLQICLQTLQKVKF